MMMEKIAMKCWDTMMMETNMMETMVMETMMLETMMMEARGKGRGPLAFSTKFSLPTFSERSEKRNILLNVQNIKKKKKIVNHLTALARPF